MKNIIYSGIYEIKFNECDKKYIGSSINIKRRFDNHICDLRKNRHRCIHLQRAFNKYEEHNLQFKIIQNG